MLPRAIPASCPTCAARGRASSPREALAKMAISSPPMCWPSTTRTTSPRKWSTRSRPAANGGRRRRSDGPAQHEPPMSIELGHFALILGFAIATMSAIGGFVFWRSGQRIALVLSQAAVLQFVLVAVAFAALIQAFVVSDFSLLLAVNNSHSLKPLIFKVSGVWGNHEGSLVL